MLFFKEIYHNKIIMDILWHMTAFVLVLCYPSSISATTGDCQEPFTQAGELCLYVSSHRSTGRKTWAGARAHCQSLGGDLLTSPPDTDKLKSSLRIITSDRRLNQGICSGIICRAATRWMGSSRDASAPWMWLSGSSQIPWRRPYPSRPSSMPACLSLAAWDGRYKDDTCDRRKAYICAPKSIPDFGPPPHLGTNHSSRFVTVINIPVVPPQSITTGNVQPGTVPTLPTTNVKGSCGLSKSFDERAVTSRIVSGQPAITGQYPWMVHFNFFSSFLEKTVPCGGTLIHKRWVLSAAHCFRFLKPNIDVYVKIGFVNLKRQEPESVLYSITKTDIITHNEFGATTLENDIALVRLPVEVPLSSLIQTICLGTNQNIPFGSKAFAAGWGLDKSSDRDIPDILHDVQLDVLPDTSCTSPQHFICTFTPGKDTCSGDSGGPLMVQEGNQWYQVGIVSHGPTDCGRSNTPAVYTRVPNYLAFINSIIRV